jgi:glycosyltransferase involved in cell wall biosynthesis
MLAGAARAARERGLETTICFSDIARGRAWLQELNDLADVRFIEGSGSRTAMPQLKRVLEEGGRLPTVLHTHFGTFDVAAALLGVQRRNTAVLWHAHSAGERRIRLRSKAYGAVLGRIVDAILCVSPEIHEECLERRFPRGKLRQMPNAIDLARFAPIAPEERAAARDRLGLPESAQVVLHFGWDWLRKGGDLLLAAADLMQEPEPVFLTVTGEGPGDAPRDRLERHPTVRALAPHGDVRELYAAADVFVNCSRAEGMPYSLLEALARGLPVLATDLPVQREVLAGLPGARVVAAEPAAIAAGLREVLALSAEQRSDHATAARARVADSHALEPWARRLVDLYEEALGGALRS